MSKGYFIGLGDKTTCGGKVLEGDNRINFFGVLHSREGDLVSCGKDGKTYRIVGGISHMVSHGRLMAGTLDSFSDCPCKARLVPSIYHATYQNEVRPTARTTAASAQPSAPAVTTHTVTSGQSSFAPTSIIPTQAEKEPDPAACNHPDMMEELASYIAGEMNANIHDPDVLEMKALINYDTSNAAKEFMKLPWYARLAGPQDFNTIAWTKKLGAMIIWTKKVGQDMEWDHKPKLRKLFPGVRHKQGKYDYFYDIWSNIHYGYVGVAGGISESVLLDGAGVEQIGSDIKRWLEDRQKNPGPHLTASLFDGLRAFDDVADRVSISIGVKLYKQYPSGGITARIIMDEVLAVAPENWGDGVRAHECK